MVDGHFSELRRALDQQALETDVVTEQELCECYTRWWSERMERDPLKPPATFVLYEPTQHKSEVQLTSLKAASLPSPIRGCHRWQLRCNDIRRKNLLAPSGLLTGVDINCTGWTGVGLQKTGGTKAAVGDCHLLG